MFLEGSDEEITSNQSTEPNNKDDSDYYVGNSLIISVSTTLFMCGALTNIRKVYRIFVTRRKQKGIFREDPKFSNFDLYSIIFFTSNLIALGSSAVFSLLQGFQSPAICQWRIPIESLFTFTTSTFLVMLATISRPREPVGKCKWRIAITTFVMLMLISASSAPYFVYSGKEENSEITNEPISISKQKIPGGITTTQTTQSPTVVNPACRFSPQNEIASYIIFIYSIIFGYACPTGILLVKLCMFNSAPSYIVNHVQIQQYRRYIVNLAAMWILCWSPHWVVEAYQFFMSMGVMGNIQMIKNVPELVTYILKTFPCQLGYVCFPFTCPEGGRVKRRYRKDEENEFIEERREDVFVIKESEDRRVSLAKSDSERRCSKLGPLSHPMSTLLNITMSLTFPWMNLPHFPGSRRNSQHIFISVTEQNAEIEDSETFL